MEVPSTEVQNNFGAYLKLAQVEDVFITRNGKRIAVLKFWEEPHQDLSQVAESKAVYRFQNPKMSIDEFLKLSASGENRYELIDGEIYQLASPSYEHQRILIEVLNVFYQWSQGKKCKPMIAPFDVTIQKDDGWNIVQPDLILICDPEKIDAQGKYNGIPRLVIEVLSESTRSKDMLKKLNLYMAGGISEYWIVNPINQELYIYSFACGEIQNYRVFKGNDTANSEILENLSIQLQRIFNG